MRGLLLFVIILLTGCATSSPLSDPNAYSVRKTKQVTEIHGCGKSKCVTSFDDGSFSILGLPLKVGDTIVFVWSEVARQWLHYRPD